VRVEIAVNRLAKISRSRGSQSEHHHGYYSSNSATLSAAVLKKLGDLYLENT